MNNSKEFKSNIALLLNYFESENGKWALFAPLAQFVDSQFHGRRTS